MQPLSSRTLALAEGKLMLHLGKVMVHRARGRINSRLEHLTENGHG